jgi:hypothetical protein
MGVRAPSAPPAGTARAPDHGESPHDPLEPDGPVPVVVGYGVPRSPVSGN